MNIFKEFKKFIEFRKAVKEVQKIIKENSQLGIDTQKAIVNLKADYEVFAGLFPKHVNVFNQIKKALFNE